MQTYDTTDFSLAVTLYTIGFRLAEIDKTAHRAVFQFELSSKIPDVVEAFFQDQLSLNPRLLLLNSRLVKDRLHAGV